MATITIGKKAKAPTKPVEVRLPKKAAQVIIDGEPETEVDNVETKDLPPAAPSVPVVAEPSRPIATAQVAAKSKSGYFRVIMLETINPAPTIGNCNVHSDEGIPVLDARKEYLLPSNVAEVLADSGKATIMR